MDVILLIDFIAGILFGLYILPALDEAFKLIIAWFEKGISEVNLDISKDNIKLQELTFESKQKMQAKNTPIGFSYNQDDIQEGDVEENGEIL